MKFGKLPDNYQDGQCPFEALEKDDYFFIVEYKGSCPICGMLQGIPDIIWAIYQGKEGQHHQFVAMEDIRCKGCGVRVNGIAVLCGNEPVDVTGEFQDIHGKQKKTS